MDTVHLVTAVFLFLIGASLGSFLNVCIFRLPLGMSIVSPPSACRYCGYRIRWRDNIPIVSFILLGGKCRACGGKLSRQYPVIELLSAVLLVANYMKFGEVGAEFMYFSFLAYLLLLIAVLDYRHYWIPNMLVLIGIAAGCAGIPFVRETTLQSAATGALATGAGLLGVRYLGYALFRRESLGWGDIKLGFMIGIFLGLQKTVLAVFLGFFLPFSSGSA